MKRRDFLKTTGLGLALASLAGAAGRVERLFAARRSPAPGELTESWKVTTCGACSAGCGILVRLVGTRVVGIRGNEANPVSRGALCARGFAGIQSLYNPDRLTGPLARSGAKSHPEWREISWDDALAETARRLAPGGSSAGSVMLITGERDTLTSQLLAKLVSVLGSANILYYPWGDPGMAHPAVYASQGITEPIAYDVQNATYILSFSGDFLQTHPSHVNLSRSFGSFRRGTSRLRGKLVHFSSRLSVTASKADEWIPVNPGTEGVAALAIASTLLEEGLYDKQFVSGECTGFDDWTDERGNRQPGFRSTLLGAFSPQKVAAVTGVSPETIIKVAREFADASRPLSMGSDRIDFTYQDLATRLAVHSLNALVGNLDKRGGVLVPRTVPAAASIASPALEARFFKEAHASPEGRFRFPVSLFATDSLLDHLLAEEPPGVLFVHAANPLFTSPRRDEWQKFFERAGFVVSFSPFMDETSQRAHVILPDSHYLEKWHERATWTGEGYPVFSIGRPVVAPLANTRNTGDVVLALVHRALGEVDASFPWKSYEDLIREQAREIHREGRGDVFGPAFEEAWVRLLERIGWRASSYPDFESFWEKCVQKGGWWDPIYYHGMRERIYGSAAGKFDFGKGLVRDRAPHVGTIESLYSLERFEEKRAEQDFPFLLDVHAHYPLLRTGSGNEPVLMELMTFQGEQSGEWRMWVEMNPRDAEALGLRHDDTVSIETPKGKAISRLALFAGIPPGVVSLPAGLGRESGGRYVARIGANPALLVGFELDPLTGIPVWGRARARVRKA